MLPALHILALWALAFVTLCIALLLLAIFFALIENDIELHSLGKEAAIAAFAALIEGVSVWVVVTFVPPAYVAIAGPHCSFPPSSLQSFTRLRTLRIGVITRFVLSCSFNSSSRALECLLLGHFAAAFGILVVFFICLAVTVAFMKAL